MAASSERAGVTPIYIEKPYSFQYSSSLNAIFSIAKNEEIQVLDIHSKSIASRASLSQSSGRSGDVLARYAQCRFLENDEKLLVISGRKIGVRCTNGEHIFLNTILQVSEIPDNGIVTIELDIVKAGLLLNELERCLKTTDTFPVASGMNSTIQKKQFHEVAIALKNSYEKAVLRMKDPSGRGIKWLTVCISMDHTLMMNVFNTALLLCKQEKRGPALPVIGDVLQRLTCIENTSYESISSEKRLMFNEVDRLQTFNSWPHMNYKWALPGPMAEAGFYHPLSKSAEDRAMCFTCSVCLVCWESADQPWSEHKRHSANCPFVKGEYTENVPLQVYSATTGAQQLSRSSDEFVCVSYNSCDNLVATGTEEGFIVVWEIHPTLKIHSEYQITVSAIKDSSRKKSKSAKSITSKPKSATEKYPDTLKEIAAEIAEMIDVKAVISATNTQKDLSESVFAKHGDKQSTPKKETGNKTVNDLTDTSVVSVGDNKMTEVEFAGESYCVIDELLYSSDNDNTTTVKTAAHNFNIFDSIFSIDNSIVASPEKDASVELETAATTVVADGEKTVTSDGDLKDKTKSVERSCKITAVTIMKDEKTNDKFIVAGVKIESKKIRKNKERQKRKLSLLVYKIAGKVKPQSSNNPVAATFAHPFSTNPFAPISSIYEDDFSMGSEEDYCMFDDADPTQLSVIDEYLLAAQKKPTASNGGTQNIGPSSNEIKTDFDQEEVVKIEDLKTVYEDCAFHKFDIDRKFYGKGMYVSDLLVVDGFLVTILKKEQSFVTHDDDNVNMLLVGTVSITKKSIIDIKLNAHQQFTRNNIINDVISIPCQKLPTKLLSDLSAVNQFEDMDNDAKQITRAPSELIALGLADNSILFLTTPHLTELRIPSNIPDGRSIHKIAYCTAMSSIAICDSEGCLTMCSCSSSPEENDDNSITNVSTPTVNQWEKRFSLQELQSLIELTKFEPATQGCYIFFPVNWYVVRSSSDANKALNHSLIPSHMLKLSPVEMDKRLIKRSEQLEFVRFSIQLSKADFTFRMFILVQTSIGYFDVLVNLKHALEDHEDFACSFFIDETPTSVNENAKSENCNGKLFCGPILFSTVMDNSKLSGQFTVCVPELLNHKSLYVIVKLEHVENSKTTFVDTNAKVSNNIYGNDTIPGNNTNQKAKQDVLIGDILKDVYVGVYQYKSAVSSFYFPGCRSVLVNDMGFLDNIVGQYLELISQNGDLRHGFEIKLILQLLVWVTNVHINSNASKDFPLISIISKQTRKFLLASYFYGDRSTCYYSTLILLGLKRCANNPSFEAVVCDAIAELLPYIHTANSSSACQWLFCLVSDFMDRSKDASFELLKMLTSLLADVGKVYAEKLTDAQKILDARYCMSEIVSDPVVGEPLYLKYKCGATLTQSCNNRFETVQIPTSYFPGILEEQPLHFSCVSVSEGSKVESFLKSKLNSLKVLKASNLGALSGSYLSHPIINHSSYLPGGLQSHQNEVAASVDAKATDDLSENVIPQSDWFNQADVLYSPLTDILNSNVKQVADKPSHLAAEDTLYDDNVIPKPMYMKVDKMHVYSFHYAILDFHAPILLSDLVFPPCKSLASITISSWNVGQPVDDALVLAHSDKISTQALVLSCILPPVELQYIKILVVGGDSCSTTIPLGNYYGHVKDEITNPSKYASRYREQYENVYCRYALTVEHMKPIPERAASAKFSLTYDVLSATIKRDYTLCAHLQLCMNVLLNNVAANCASNLLMDKHLDKDLSDLPSVATKSVSFLQLMLNCLLKCIAYYLSSLESSTSLPLSNGNSGILSREQFTNLFKCVCLYGTSTLTTASISVLYLMCGKMKWWCDALMDVFKYCFYGTTMSIVLPRQRLFNTFIKLFMNTENLNEIVEKLLTILQHRLVPYITTQKNVDVNNSPPFEMCIAVLLALNEILDSKDSTLWNFFSPWDYLSNDLSESAHVGAVPVDTWNYPWDPFSVKAKQQKGNLHPLVTKKVDGQTETSNKRMAEEETNKLKSDKTATVVKIFIPKSNALPVLKALLTFVIGKLQIGNPEQVILSCKVSSLIISNCESLIFIEDLLSCDELQKLVSFCLLNTSNKWIVLAIDTLFKSFIEQKNGWLKNVSSDNETIHETCATVSPLDASRSERENLKLRFPRTGSKTAKKKSGLGFQISEQFYQATEGALKLASLNVHSAVNLNNEIESTLSAKECEVTHVVQNRFGKVLEQILHKVQEQFHNVSPIVHTPASVEQQTDIEIPTSDELVTEIIFMQSSSLSYLLKTFIELTQVNANSKQDTIWLEQLLFLTNLVQDNQCEIDRKIQDGICALVLKAMKNSETQQDVAVHSLLKKLARIIIQMPAVGSSFSLQLLYLQRNQGFCNTGLNLGDFTLMSLKELLHKEVILPPERKMLKQFLLSIVWSRKFNEDTSILSVLKDVRESGVFLQFDGEEEIQASANIISVIANKVKEFIQSSAVLIQAAQQDRVDTKRTIFLLHEGKVRLAGKAHVLENDIKECLALLDIAKVIFNSNVFDENTEHLAKETFQILLDCLCSSGNLATHSKLLQYVTVTLDLPAALQTVKLHPLALTVLHILIDISKERYWKNLIDAVVTVLKKLSTGDNSFSHDGLKLFIKKFLGHSNERWKEFVNKGGFEIITNSLLKHSHENIIWTDSRKHCPTIHELFANLLPITSASTVDKDRLRKDDDGVVLENFAPCARIYGPSSSPAAGVLLINKSPLRRSRFAAWGHQFQETENPWIELDIVFPFEVMLKEAVIYMHSNFLIGAPSEVIVEVKGINGSFTSVSPSLATGGLHSIVLHFVEGKICKEIRFCLKRPNGADHIKLNLIEFYGRSVFSSVDDGGYVLEKKSPSELWCDLSVQLFAGLPHAIVTLNNHPNVYEIISALLTALPFLSRSSLLHVSLTLVMNILPAVPDIGFQTTKHVTSNLSNHHYLNCLNKFQLKPLIQLLAAVIRESTVTQRIRIFSFVLEWFSTYLRILAEDKENATVIDVLQHFTMNILALISELQVEHLNQIAVSVGLTSLLEELLLKQDESLPKSFTYLCRVLSHLVLLQPHVAKTYLSTAQTRLNSLLTDTDITSNFQALAIPIYCYNSQHTELKINCFSYFDQLSIALCDVLKNITTVCDIENHMGSLLFALTRLLSVFCTFSQSLFNAKVWFSTDHGRMFWKPLVRFITTTDLMKRWPSRMFTAQQLTLSVFQDILSLNQSNQEYFSQLLIEILTEKQHRNLSLNCYLKVILLQLVIAEDVVEIEFKLKSDTYNLQNKHQIKFPVTSTLSEVEINLMKISNQFNIKMKTALSTSQTNQNNGVSTPADLSSHMSNVAGHMAVLKRKPKPKTLSKDEESNTNQDGGHAVGLEFYLPSVSEKPLPKQAQFGQILQQLRDRDPSFLNKPPVLEYVTKTVKTEKNIVKETTSTEFDEHPTECDYDITHSSSIPTMLEIFANHGGLSFLTSLQQDTDQMSGGSQYLQLFSMILPLPGFSKVFLKDRRKAECLLRLMLGVKETKPGQQIQSLSIGQDLLALPLKSLCCLLQDSPSSSRDGITLRKMVLQQNAMSQVLNTLDRYAGGKKETSSFAFHGSFDTVSAGVGTSSLDHTNGGKSQETMTSTVDTNYWAKGTGFGTGSTVSSWDIERAIKNKEKEEEHIVIILQLVASFINSNEREDNLDSILKNIIDNFTTEVENTNSEYENLMKEFEQLLSKHSIVSLLANHLRNDSVLDMSRHIPLYHCVMSTLRSFASSSSLLPLVTSLRGKTHGSADGSGVLVKLLSKLKACVDTYQSRLKVTSKSKSKSNKHQQKSPNIVVNGNKYQHGYVPACSTEPKVQETLEKDTFELNLLLNDIHKTTEYVSSRVQHYERFLNGTQAFHQQLFDQHIGDTDLSCTTRSQQNAEDRYINDMGALQFDTYELVTEKDDCSLQFNVPYHYAASVLAAAKSGDSINAARSRRLAQEVASLSTSLPLSVSSTVFLQCDEERLDVMKVLITGPDDTPYENGCFEFDIYFPQDYPNSPMSVNLQTTGKNTVRFNPNLYNDGKVCLSILNTWHGKPEERWNPQTSNLLQVLVSIQSLILVSDPYFNEPGYERLRSTPQGKQNSSDYNANIEQATVKWAILEQIKRPSGCFKEIIHRHFLLKKDKVLLQCDRWLKELQEQAIKRKSTAHSYEAFKTHYRELKLELLKLEALENAKSASLNKNGAVGNTALENAIATNSTGNRVNATDSRDASKTDEGTNINQNKTEQKHLMNEVIFL